MTSQVKKLSSFEEGDKAVFSSQDSNQNIIFQSSGNENKNIKSKKNQALINQDEIEIEDIDEVNENQKQQPIVKNNHKLSIENNDDEQINSEKNIKTDNCLQQIQDQKIFNEINQDKTKQMQLKQQNRTFKSKNQFNLNGNQDQQNIQQQDQDQQIQETEQQRSSGSYDANKSINQDQVSDSSRNKKIKQKKGYQQQITIDIIDQKYEKPLKKKIKQKKQTVIQPELLVELVKSYKKKNKIWFVMNIIFIILCIFIIILYSVFPNEKKNYFRIVGISLTILEFCLWMAGCYQGYQSIQQIQYDRIKNSLKFIKISIIPQVLACLLGELFFIYADQQHKTWFIIGIFFLFFINILIAYFKIFGFIKKGIELFEFIEAFEIEQQKIQQKNLQYYLEQDQNQKFDTKN